MRALIYVTGECVSRNGRKFSIAHDDTYTNKKGETNTTTHYFEIQGDKDLPNVGETVLIEGSLSSYRTEKSGNNEYKTIIMASKIVRISE